MATPIMANPRTSAFSLVELIVIMVVLAILSGIAIPKYYDHAARAKVTATVADIRTIRSAFTQYRIDYGAYPAQTSAPGIMPPEIADRFMDDPFRRGPAIGGAYQWLSAPGWSGLYIVTTPGNTALWTQVDSAVDDGNFYGGTLTDWGGGEFAWQFPY